MIGRAGEDVTGWADAIEAQLATIDGCCVSRVFVYGSVSSTQEAAWRHRLHDTGVVAIASSQTHGRGQRGRVWEDGDALTLPVSFALATGMDDVGLAARAGLAAMEACHHAAPGADIRIKWPNDVVVRTNTEDRKLAGVLIERRDDFAVVGVGVNVFCAEQDTARARPYRAVSVEELGGRPDRCALAADLVRTMSAWLGAPDDHVRARWADHDAMVGTDRAFVTGNERVAGRVIGLDPLDAIRVHTGGGERSLGVGVTRTAEA